MTYESDKTYAVVITATVYEAIFEQARYIAVDQKAPQNAAQWLDRVWTAIDGLEFMPRRHNLAAEDAYLPYEVRRVSLDSHLILFTVSPDEPTVYVIGLRHGARLPRPQDLPEDNA